MYDNVFVEVRYPSTNSSYDFVAPAHLKISEIAKLMSKIIKEHDHMEFEIDKDMLLLFDLERKTFLPPDKTMAASGVMDGSRLMLV